MQTCYRRRNIMFLCSCVSSILNWLSHSPCACRLPIYRHNGWNIWCQKYSVHHNLSSFDNCRMDRQEQFWCKRQRPYIETGHPSGRREDFAEDVPFQISILRTFHHHSLNFILEVAYAQLLIWTKMESGTASTNIPEHGTFLRKWNFSLSVLSFGCWASTLPQIPLKNPLVENNFLLFSTKRNPTRNPEVISGFLKTAAIWWWILRKSEVLTSSEVVQKI